MGFISQSETKNLDMLVSPSQVCVSCIGCPTNFIFIFCGAVLKRKQQQFLFCTLLQNTTLFLDFHRKIALPGMEKPVVNTETVFPPPTEIFDFLYAGKVFRVIRSVGPCIVTVNIKYCENTFYDTLVVVFI